MKTTNYPASIIDDGAHIIIEQIEEECRAIHSHAESSALALFSNLSSKIPGWINGYRCHNHVDNIFKMQSQVKAYTEELTGYLQDDIKRETQDWVSNSFVPMIQREITTLSKAVDARTDEYYGKLSKLSLSVDVNKNDIVIRTTPSKRNRILSTGACILIGDLGGAIMGGAGGSDAMFKTLGCEFGAGIVLGIISLFTPVGLAAMVCSAIISAFIGGSWALNSVEKNIRKTLVEKCRESINSSERKNRLIRDIDTKIDSYLNIILEDVRWNLKQCS